MRALDSTGECTTRSEVDHVIRRFRSAATAAVLAISATTMVAAPTQAAGIPTECSYWRQSGALEIRACVADYYPTNTIRHIVEARNLSTTSKSLDASVDAWVKDDVVRTCSWSNVSIPGSGTVSRYCTTTPVAGYGYRTTARGRFGTNAYISVTSPWYTN